MIPRPSFFTLEDLQEPPERGGWGLTRDALMTLAEDGQLTLSLKTIAGVPRDGITRVERERAEREAAPELEHPGKVKSLQFLVGALAIIWTAEDADLMAHHYELRDFLAGDFEAKGITPLRSRETDAELIRDAIKLVRESGLYRPKRQREVDALRAKQERTQEPAAGEQAAA
jgi:hypothetical protein